MTPLIISDMHYGMCVCARVCARVCVCVWGGGGVKSVGVGFIVYISERGLNQWGGGGGEGRIRREGGVKSLRELTEESHKLISPSMHCNFLATAYPATFVDLLHAQLLKNLQFFYYSFRFKFRSRSISLSESC